MAADANSRILGAMSEENVEQQYRAADALSRRDLGAFLAVCHPEIELISRHLALDGSAQLRGHAAREGF
jgi:hypothetical protein